jgi:hypothetical protein
MFARSLLAPALISLCVPAIAYAQEGAAFEPITIVDQGSFAAGGTVAKEPGTFDNEAPSRAGQTFHGDHLYAFYQVPEDARPLPLVFWHGAFQSAKSWETTADGREGFQTIFLRRNFPVYLIDQPRRGRAGNSMEPMELAHAERSAVLRPVPHRAVAGLSRGRAVRQVRGDARAVSPGGDSQHRPL